MLHSQETASDMLEEGGDDVKSAWPLWAGPRTCYNGNDNGKQGRKAERIRKDCLSKAAIDFSLIHHMGEGEPVELSTYGRGIIAHSFICPPPNKHQG